MRGQDRESQRLRRDRAESVGRPHGDPENAVLTRDAGQAARARVEANTDRQAAGDDPVAEGPDAADLGDQGRVAAALDPGAQASRSDRELLRHRQRHVDRRRQPGGVLDGQRERERAGGERYARESSRWPGRASGRAGASRPPATTCRARVHRAPSAPARTACSPRRARARSSWRRRAARRRRASASSCRSGCPPWRAP